MICFVLQGLPQQINIAFAEPISVPTNGSTSNLRIKFQGGFVGSEMRLNLINTSGESAYKNTFYPDDVNDLQVFPLIASSADVLDNIRKVEIVFDKSSDFFGRIIIYNLEMICWYSAYWLYAWQMLKKKSIYKFKKSARKLLKSNSMIFSDNQSKSILFSL